MLGFAAVLGFVAKDLGFVEVMGEFGNRILQGDGFRLLFGFAFFHGGSLGLVNGRDVSVAQSKGKTMKFQKFLCHTVFN